MRKTSLLLLSLLLVSFAFGEPVTLEKARLVANKYLSASNLKSSRSISASFSKTYNGITTFHVFNFEGGGFIVVSADDVAIPVLAESDQGYIETEITNPATRYWFDCYSREIAAAVASGADNTATSAEWNTILNNQIKEPTADVAPLLTTTWDQNGYYNYYCPTATGGPAGKAYVGCVATAMGQIMKYHNFPVTGVGSYSYMDGTYGLQTANFGNTNYNFAAMANVASNTNGYRDIAKLLYHAGVSVDMAYGVDEGSGAFSEDVPWALTTYFNYDNATIRQEFMSAYNATDWKNLIKSELDARRPVYYSGSGTDGGHAWVCDGYRNSDGKFHMNWGWSGVSNGYFAIGALTTPAGTFNSSNSIVCGIKPGNANLIVRFTNLEQYNSISASGNFDIKYSVVKGSPLAVNLYINNQLANTTTSAESTYSWNTSGVPLGTYTVRVEAIDATDTVYQEVNVGLSEWITQSTAFTSAFRGIQNIHVVDPQTVWATAADFNPVSSKQITDFTKTSNGGTTWSSGSVLGWDGFGLGNICGVDNNTAFVSVYSQATQNDTCGVYKTTDGGNTWVHLTGALQGSSSFADNVWFWNANEGMCHGDVKNNYFEIYTTTNGGTTWTRVSKSKIGGGVTPATDEGGWTSVIQAVGASTVMFGTNKGNLYISHDKGLNWTVSNTGISPLTSGVQKICFKDEMNGLVVQTTTNTVMKETHDGGATWQPVSPTGPFQKGDIVFVPGTESTLVSVGSGASYSFDFGHSWSKAAGTDYNPFTAVAFINNQSGWAGGINNSSLQEGIHKYIGVLVPEAVRNPVSELNVQAVEQTVQLSWVKPDVTPLSYNIYRNDTLIKNTTELQYTDSPVAKGQQLYCVTAVYTGGESQRTCISTWIALGISETDEVAYHVYPNPTSDIINIVTPIKFTEVRMINSQGKLVYRNNTKSTNLHILTEGFEPGMYILQIYAGIQPISKKIMIIR